MKIIFLDCDGVINKYGSEPIDDGLMDNLQRIVEETGAKIVISSTWRLYRDLFSGILEACKKLDLEVIGSTPELNAPRHEEISEWFIEKDINPEETSYAVIDDYSDAAGEHPFFQTTQRDGLTPEISDKVIDHLTK